MENVVVELVKEAVRKVEGQGIWEVAEYPVVVVKRDGNEKGITI